jgi:hypothetical protein
MLKMSAMSDEMETVKELKMLENENQEKHIYFYVDIATHLPGTEREYQDPRKDSRGGLAKLHQLTLQGKMYESPNGRGHTSRK